MQLRNVHTISSDIRKDIRILNGKIQEVAVHSSVAKDEFSINLDGALVFPGLINSHDHLDFNCFPPLAHRMYANYREWGNDIQVRDKSIIEKVLNIPENLRKKWGIYKNLLNGVTTVVNHGKFLQIDDCPIQVFQNSHSYHSVGFEKNWKWKINRPQKTAWPLVLHNGEGTDDIASAEIDELIRWNIFKKDMIAVHGTMMNTQQAKNFKALIWCPASNIFLLGKTAAVKELKESTKILFGTDSSLTADWNIWKQLRMARNEHALTDEELFDALTYTAASVWKLKDTGEIREGYWADMVIAKAKTWNDFYHLNPDDLLLVMSRGKIVLFDETLFKLMHSVNISLENFDKIYLPQSQKFIAGKISHLANTIREYYKDALFPFTTEARLHAEPI